MVWIAGVSKAGYDFAGRWLKMPHVDARSQGHLDNDASPGSAIPGIITGAEQPVPVNITARINPW